MAMINRNDGLARCPIQSDGHRVPDYREMCSFVVLAERQNEDSSGTRNSHNMRIRRRGRIAARVHKI